MCCKKNTLERHSLSNNEQTDSLDVGVKVVIGGISGGGGACEKCKPLTKGGPEGVYGTGARGFNGRAFGLEAEVIAGILALRTQLRQYN